MKLVIFYFLLISFFFFASCSTEPPLAEAALETPAEPEPYLYQPPPSIVTGWPSARIKREALAEAFVSRLSTKRPASVIVMQQEKLVLEEHFEKQPDSLVCSEALYPAYGGAIMGSLLYTNSTVPYPLIPIEKLYLAEDKASSLSPSGGWFIPHKLSTTSALRQLEQLVQKHTGTTLGMAAEELLFEPLQIDDYLWKEEALCLHPYAMLQLGSLWVRRGRWGEKQVLPTSLVQRVLAPAYEATVASGKQLNGWQYYRLMAKGRKQPLLYWEANGTHLFLLPELEAVVLLQGDEQLLSEGWSWLQDYLIPSLTP